VTCFLFFHPVSSSWPSLAVAFVVVKHRHNFDDVTRIQGHKYTRTCRFSQADSSKEQGHGDHKDDDDDDDDENEGQTPYRNRSLAWTNRYRKLIPYEKARAMAMTLGLQSEQDWDDFLEAGRVYQFGPYLPNRPDEMYVDDWVSWEEFLGVMRPYEETRQLVQHVLKLSSMQEYRAFVKADPKRAEGLRIPAKPEIVYKDDGWISEEHFFCCDSRPSN